MMKRAIKGLAYGSGALSLWHRRRNRVNLTTVMFHRVLPRGSRQFARADRTYALDAALFEACLAFFRRHYTVVGLADVLAWQRGGARPPRCPLLITFDDGWRDTLSVAAPLLAAAGLPAVCFIAAGVLDDPDPSWWQEDFTLAWREGLADAAKIADAIAACGGSAAGSPGLTAGGTYLHALAALAALPGGRRRSVLGRLDIPETTFGLRHMLTAAEIPALIAQGIAVGGHGVSHLPLTMVASPRDELRGARRRLEQACAGTPQTAVESMSFPHGRYDAALVDAARAEGYRLVFTSDPVLTNSRLSGAPPPTFGRISIGEADICGADGRFSGERLAWHLFTRSAA